MYHFRNTPEQSTFTEVKTRDAKREGESRRHFNENTIVEPREKRTKIWMKKIKSIFER
jgi:hypothetical protein